MIELLVVADRPNEGPALAVLRTAAALAGVDAGQVTVTVIDSAGEARRRGFVGSPTFLIDGVDPFALSGEPDRGDAPGVCDGERPGGSAGGREFADALLRG